MNKGDFINKIVDSVNFFKVQVIDVLNVVFDGIIDLLKGGDKVILIGFGIFFVFYCEVCSGCNL